jgi:1-deoxy-D-xylulose-5-phosphate reductoisomerase
LVLLGSTGSIGVNTIKIAQKFNTPIEVLSAGYNIELLNKQIEIIKPKIVVVASQDDVSKVAHDRVYSTQDGIIRAIEESKSNLVVNAIVGFAGLKATIKRTS